MINEILSQLKLIEEQLHNLQSQNIPRYLKEEELKLLNEKLDALSLCIDNL